LINRPPVFTNRCCKLVDDQPSILCGTTSRRHEKIRHLASFETET